MTDPTLIALFIEVRAAQREYVRSGSLASLAKRNNLEHRVDQALIERARAQAQPGLFGGGKDG